MPVIEYAYSVHSAFAYIGSAKLQEICAKHSVTLIHRPMLLSPVVQQQRSPTFRARTQANVDYFFGREIERWAEYRDVPIIKYRPTFHDEDYGLASGMILALGDRGATIDAMSHKLLEAHWRDDADQSDLPTLHRLATELGHDADALLAAAGTEAIQKKLQANTEWAIANNIFGSPTYILDGDPFYGQDHLDLVERALTTPFAPSSWKNPPVAALNRQK
ncbi:2-hydroxychromene-2-carboxylate isomerase [Maritalea sp. S77]|uniref:2-hydroxychromene-2-carboxylate isomerase n=1 Tax=Maritalea sp. S77 TaxID=3415125 RepID=UPI003C7C5D1F